VKRFLTLGTVLAGILLGWLPRAFALEPALDISQYAHTAWTIREGFSKGTIVAIAQTQDGYLWLGTEFGLLRFDGVRTVLWQPPGNQNLPSNYIHSLLATRDGSLWIGTAEGLVRWKGGTVTRYAEFDGQSVSALLEDREGAVWAGGHGGPTARFCSYHDEKAQCYGQDGSFGAYVDSLYEDRAGNLWVGAVTGLWRWKPDQPKRYPVPDRVQAILEGPNHSLLLAMLSGVRQFADGKLEPYPFPQRFSARGILEDRDGGLWIGTTDRGLVHSHQGRNDGFEHSDGLSSDFIEQMFEDREGNIWVATLDGLDRFRDLAVPTITVKQGLSNATVKSVLAARDGSVWLATADGLNRWNQGRMMTYRKNRARSTVGDTFKDVHEIDGTGLPDDATESLFQDAQDRIWVSTRNGVAFFEKDRFTPVPVPGDVHSISGDQAGNLWISQGESLFHLRDGRVVEQIPWAKLGRPDGARALLADVSGGGLWLAFRDGGVGYFKDGSVRASYSVADGLGSGHVRDLQFDREGTLWVSTEGGLSRVKDGRIVTLNSKNGLPCDSVHWAMEDDDRTLWLYMACGLARVSRQELDAWAAGAGTVSTRRVQFTVLDASDGVRSHSTTTGYCPSVAKSADGKLWFLPWDGVSVLDPRHLPVNGLPPPVHVEQITADHKTHDTITGGQERLRLPPLVRDLEIDYTALSLVTAEKVFFRYKLDGRDHDWQDVGNRRQAFYSNLAPGNYTFRVSACNNSGVWSEGNTFLDFSVASAYYQTTWFRLSLLAVFLALLGAVYRLRLQQMARQFDIRLEERVSERTRIAQELHDTLLQGFLSVSMQVHVAVDRLPEDSAVKPILTLALKSMSRVIEEGRNAVRGLRVSHSPSLDLEHAFSLLPREFAAFGADKIDFRVIIDGPQRPLHPLLRDEVYRFGREALLNAFRHARANHIEIEVKYSSSQLLVLVRDDGSGIDPKIVAHGKDGLSGMRERADRIGARLHVYSSTLSGTEIELAIPGHVAYLDKTSTRLKWFAMPGRGNRRSPVQNKSGK
jgi:signal transduction histidine kinase/ligand-binding sensor domain-containing protein